MKGLLRLLLLLCIAVPTRAQNVEQCYTISGFADTDGTNGYNFNTTIRANASKEIVMVGNNKVFRVSKEGSKQWEKTLTASLYDYNIDASGNVIVSHNSGYKLIKYNSNGTTAWEKTYTDQYIYKLAVDDAGNVLATGYDFNSGGLYLVKYSSNGTLAWQKIIANGFGNGVATNSAGDVYVMGPDYSNGGNMLIKYSSNGTFQWQKAINYSFASNLLKVGPDGTVYTFLYDNFSTRVLKINPGSGGTLNDVLLDYGHIAVAFGPSNSVYVLGSAGGGLYNVYKLNSNFTGGVFKALQYFTLNDFDYRTIEVESDGIVTVSIISGFEDDREGAFYTLNAAGEYIGGQALYFYGFPLTGHIIDYQGNYLVATNYDCLKKLTPCFKVPFNINSQPSNQTVCAGTDAQFTVGVTGLGVLYQWKKGSVYLRNDAKYAGVNTGTLTVKAATPTDDAGTYTCEIYDACYVETFNGDPERKLISQSVSINFIGPSTISVQPANVSQCAGTDAVFQITTTGGQNVKYQWRKGATPLVESATVVGSKTNKLTLKTIAAGDAAQYFCDVTSDCFASPQVSQQAILTLLQATSISSQPTGVATCGGATAVFTVVAGGTGLTYQWRKGGVNLTESATAVGTKTNVLSIKLVKTADAGDYSCVVTGTCGAPVISGNAALSVTAASQITTQPASKEVCSGASVSLTVAATGSALVYSWRKGNTVLSNGGKYSGTNTATLNISSTTSAEEGQYSCVVSSSCGADLISTVAQLSIGTAPSITGKSADLKLCEGEVAKMAVTVTGGLIKYQWKKNGTALTDASGILGSKARELFIQNIKSADAGNYTCDVSTDCGAVQVSGPIKLELSSELVLTPGLQTKKGCTGEQVSIAAALTGTVQTYQWKKNGVNLVNNTTYSGVKTATLIIKSAASTEEGFYSCEVLSSCGKLLLTNDTKLEVNSTPNLVLLDVDCNAFPTEWASLVMDVNNIFGEYEVFRSGTTSPLPGLHSATQTGLYLIVKSNGVCADTVEWNNDCVITAIEKSEAEFSISPNPSSGTFNVQHQMPLQRFDLFDTRGVAVMSDQLTGEKEHVVDASAFADGVYYFTVSTKDGKRISKRIVIRR